jgi:hypothetical protein
LNFSQLEGVCYCCSKKGHKSPQFKHNKRPKSKWVINKTKEAAFITQAAARSEEQSVVPSIPQPTPIPDAQQASSNVQQGELHTQGSQYFSLIPDSRFRQPLSRTIRLGLPLCAVKPLCHIASAFALHTVNAAVWN